MTARVTFELYYKVRLNEHISVDQYEYEHAKKVWNMFNMRSIGGYHDLYLGSDVFLLSDVFENFRNTCLHYYKLDPCHYFTSPGLSGMLC